MKQITLRFIVMALFAPLQAAMAAGAPPAMIVPGQFNVSANGAATYTIPIVVPPGTAGMVPALSLDYSSQQSNGIVGMGWALSGLPSITRCPRTLAQDTVHGSVNYDSNDRFCLDGQRLILIGGTYGADGSQYRTELESYSNIVAHGSAGSGPAWFEVRTKAGQRMQFGNSADSAVRVVSVASGVVDTVRVWAVNRVEDTVGNYLTVTYNCATSGGACADRTVYGEAYPVRVDYTGHASSPTIAPYNSVRFIYQCQEGSAPCRADSIPAYQAGGRVQTTVLLENIQTYRTDGGGDHLVSDYRLAYRSGTSTVRSRLTSVTLCDATSNCLVPTTFGWQGGSEYLTLNSGSSFPATQYSYPYVPGDFNGDGYLDVLPLISNCNYPSFSIMGGPSFTSSVGTFDNVFYNGGWTSCFYDSQAQTFVASNGANNLLILAQAHLEMEGGIAYTYNMGYIFNTASNGGSYSTGSWFYLGYDAFPPPTIVGDFNGDGISDFMVQGTPSKVRYGNSTGGFDSPVDGGSYNPSTTSVVAADFDGNGCADFFVSGATNSIVYSCNPAVTTVTPPAIPSGYTVTIGDFNGDGKADILMASKTSAAKLYLSTGTDFALVNSSLPSDWGKYAIRVADVDGDGKSDLWLVASGGSGNYGSGTSHKLYLSTGTDFTAALSGGGAPITISNSSTYGTGSVAADWNSDGATDLLLNMLLADGGDTLYTMAYTPEFLSSVSNGLGTSIANSNTVFISYLPLNVGGPFYTKGTSASYPTQDLIGSLYFVSRVDSSDGLGVCARPSSYTNCYSSAYSYAGAQVDLRGRGFLGFSQMVVKDLQTNIAQTTNYSRTFPRLGLITSQTKSYGTNTHALNSITNTYADNSISGGCGVGASTGVYVVCLTQTVTSGYDLNDTAALPVITTDYTYDAYGNALTINASVNDGSYKNTTNTYDNDATNWFLGRLRTAAVNSIVGASNLTRHSSFTYDSSTGLLTQEVVEAGISTCNSGSSSCTATTTYGYDAFGHRNTTTTSGSGIATRTSSAEWGSNGQFQISATNALNESETWAYDERFGLPTSHTGPNNLTTTWTYDGFGRGILQTQPDGTKSQQSYAYCSGIGGGGASCPSYGAYLATTQVFASDGVTQVGPTRTIYYDILSRSIAADTQGYDGSTIRVTTLYDSNGRVEKTSRPYFTSAPPCPSSQPCWTNFSYDALGRVTQTTYPDASYTTTVFNGLTTSVTDALSHTTITAKNAQGLTANVVDANSNTTYYVYDAFGNPISVTDPMGNVVANTYDIRGRKVATRDPDMGNWTYIYDVLGQLTNQTDAKSQTSALTYDLLGRVLTRDEPGLYSIWTYGTDAANHNVGQLTQAKACASSSCSNVVSDRTFIYDNLGRPYTTSLTTAAGGGPSVYTKTYNTTNGQIDTVTYPSGLVQKSLYNTRGYQCRITDNGGSHSCSSSADSHVLWSIDSRDAELHLTQSTAGNGVVTKQRFDPKTGLATCTYTGGACNSTGTVASLGFSFDAIGNLRSRTDSNTGYTESFCYDSLNRLIAYAMDSVCTGGKTVTYDAVGNITTKSGVGTYSYPTSGSFSVRPHAVSSITGTVNGAVNPNYDYDANGNLTCVYTGVSCGGGVAVQTVTMTSFNMTSVIAQSGGSASLTYDSEHARIRQIGIVGGVTTVTDYLNDPTSGAMSEKVTAGAAAPTFTDYLVVDGKIMGQRQVAPLWGSVVWNQFSWKAPPPTAAWSFFVLDHLGSVAVVTDASGNVTQRFFYDASGRQRNANGTDIACSSTARATSRGFTNQEQIPGACLVNLNARLYDPTIGKFLSADPIVGDPGIPNAFNRYAYVLNNPLSFTDPSGLCFLGCFWNSKEFRGILAIAVAVVFQRYELLPKIGASLGFTTSSAALAATVNGAIAGGIAGGIAAGNLKGAGLGALSGGLFAQAGNFLEGADGLRIFGSHDAGAFAAHGLVGGITSVAGGGNFGSGFLAGGFSSLADISAFNTGDFIGNVVEHAAIGGFASILGGGKFANGAETGAFGYLFNFCVHNTKTCFATNATNALQHYRQGSGTALDMQFSEIDTSNVAPTDFKQVHDLLNTGGPGHYNIDAREPYTTNNTFWSLGNITLRLQGVLTIDKAGAWSFSGNLKSFNDTYDFNASTHRSLLGEAMTGLGRMFPGKQYQVDIYGSKPLNGHGNVP